MRIGWVGLGLMGRPMAAQLVRAGHDVVVTSRRAASGDELRAMGARWADSAHECAAARDVVIFMLPSPATVKAVFAEVLDDDPPPLIVDMSTSGPRLALALAASGESAGAYVVDAPVSGGPAGASAGSLAIMVGAVDEAFDLSLPVLSCLGQPHRMGGPGAGQRAKLLNQVLLAGVMAGMSEAFAVTRGYGIDAERIFTAVRGGLAGSALLEWAWPKLALDDLSPAFKIDHLIKDLHLAVEDGEAVGLDLEFTRHVLQQYQELALGGNGELGIQALVLAAGNDWPTK